ncbi:hypothetical protein [Kingella oralis]|uniref:hypothetical protein n=1 Tax=Kingella oralis TaxID=505 RepID=UPI002D7EC8E2|nr:hypothetical protein [Kingella oralis]
MPNTTTSPAHGLPASRRERELTFQAASTIPPTPRQGSSQYCLPSASLVYKFEQSGVGRILAYLLTPAQ